MSRIFAYLLTAVFGLTLLYFPTSAAGEEARVTVTASRLNVRESPSTDAGILGSVVRGDILARLDEQPGWLKVRTAAGLIGWVSRAHVEPLPPQEVGGSSAPAKPENKVTPQVTAPAPLARKSTAGRRILKYTCLVGAGATAVLAYTEHSAGNDAYERYKDLTHAGDAAAAETKYRETGQHDDRAQTWMIVSGVLAGAYLVQEFLLDRGTADRAALERTPPLRIGWRPGDREVSAAVVIMRY